MAEVLSALDTPTKHGVVTDVTVLPVHMGQDSAAAPKIKTKTAPAQPLKALLHLDEATTTQPTIARAAPLADEATATRARPRALTQPLVFLPEDFHQGCAPGGRSGRGQAIQRGLPWSSLRPLRLGRYL